MEGATTYSEIQSIFTDAAGSIGDMMIPIMTAGVVIALGILAFSIGKKLLKKSTN